MFHRLSTKSSYIHLEGFEKPAVEPPELPEAVLVRQATATDIPAIRVLARLEDRRLPEGPYLVGELAGSIVAAISLPTGAVVADPFRRTAHAAELLRLRAAQVAEQDRGAAVPTGPTALKPATA